MYMNNSSLVLQKKYQTAALAYKTSYYKNFVCGTSSLKLTQKTCVCGSSHTAAAAAKENVVNSIVIL